MVGFRFVVVSHSGSRHKSSGWRHNRREAAPELHKTRVRKFGPIQARRVGQVNIGTISAAHNQNMAAGIFGWRKTDDDRRTTIGGSDHLVQAQIMPPGCLKTELRPRTLNPHFFKQALLGRDLVNRGLGL